MGHAEHLKIHSGKNGWDSQEGSMEEINRSEIKEQCANKGTGL